jgi:CheY-like chemotaxis protein
MARILLIEDDHPSILYVRTICEAEGHLVDAASMGADGIARFRRGAYDVVLLDLRLPDMGGDEVLKALRAEPGATAIPVIGLTATCTSNDYAMLSELLAAGFSDVFTKPIRRKTLLAAIQNHLGT